MNKWLVIHPKDECVKYPMIGSKQKPKKFMRFKESKQPTDEEFEKIKKGDLIAYYSFCDRALVGLFKVTSDICVWEGRGDWLVPSMVYSIEPFKLPFEGDHYFDLDQFLNDNVVFDKSYRPSLEFLMEEKRCLLLSDSMFQELEKAFSNPKYIKLKNQESPDIGLVGALLDFYNSRATSFVSLFVASIFGIVTLSAIIENFGNTPLLFVCSLVPYAAFVLAASYTLRRYSFYADITEKLQYDGLQSPNEFELKKLKLITTEDKRKYYLTDFTNFRKNKAVLWEKRLLNKIPFESLYISVIFFLTIIVYRHFIQDIVAFLGAFLLIEILALLVLVGVLIYEISKYKDKTKKQLGQFP